MCRVRLDETFAARLLQWALLRLTEWLARILPRRRR